MSEVNVKNILQELKEFRTKLKIERGNIKLTSGSRKWNICNYAYINDKDVAIIGFVKNKKFFRLVGTKNRILITCILFLVGYCLKEIYGSKLKEMNLEDRIDVLELEREIIEIIREKIKEKIKL